MKDETEEIDFTEDLIAFLKIKFPKHYTDQEKTVLKQLQNLSDEKAELKEVLMKKNGEGKYKPISLVNEVSSYEAKEKAIKLVREGTLHFASKSKSLDHSDLDLEESQPKKDNDKLKSIKSVEFDSTSKSKFSQSKSISFISGGVEFNEDSKINKRKLSPDDEDIRHESNFKKLSRQIDSEEILEEEITEFTSNKDINKTESEDNATNTIRICGYNVDEQLAKRLIDPIAEGTYSSIELEHGYNNSVNVVVKFESVEVAKMVKDRLDTQYLEGRVIYVYYKQENIGGRRNMRRRRRQDYGWGRSRSNFGQLNTSTNLPPHIFNSRSSVCDRPSNDNLNNRFDDMQWFGSDQRKEDSQNNTSNDSVEDNNNLITSMRTFGEVQSGLNSNVVHNSQQNSFGSGKITANQDNVLQVNDTSVNAREIMSYEDLYN